MPTPVHRIRANALANPSQPALYGPVGRGWRQLGWGAWWASVRQAAGGLIEIGVPPGSSVVIWAPSSPEWAVLWPAVLAVGATPVLLSPAADDPDLLLALGEPEVRHVVVGGRQRLERLLVVREAGLELERIVSLERLSVLAPRLVDLDGLIERGASRLENVERRVGALQPTGIAARVAGGPTVHFDELMGDPGELAAVGISGDPATRAAAVAAAQATVAAAELWMAREPAPLLEAIRESTFGLLYLDPEGWERVARDLEQRIGEAGGVGGGLARIWRQSGGGEGPVGAAARSVLSPILREAGLSHARLRSTRKLDPAVSWAMRAMGLSVEG